MLRRMGPYDYQDEDDDDGFWDDADRRPRMIALFVLIGLAGLLAGLALGFIVDLAVRR